MTKSWCRNDIAILDCDTKKQFVSVSKESMVATVTTMVGNSTLLPCGMDLENE